ncbi:MAG: molybdopterin-dependent oxidoreductase [Pirellulales bacterium]|nr:molybdopterin-dependent oxidoreductase [Pirellulales bacterium]
MNADRFLRQHLYLTRRHFFRKGTAGALAWAALPAMAKQGAGNESLQAAVDRLPSWLTPQDDFQDVSRGNPKPHTLSLQQRKEAGLTRETWKLEVVSDPEHPSRLRLPRTQKDGTALDFAALMELAQEHAVRFPKVMTCLNIGCPLGNGIWEGVPLRSVLWLAQPVKDLRRVFYYGYHNHDEAQMFRSSLPVGRVLEDPFDLPPVILCYKLNGRWLTPQRGGPVRVVVPEAYGFKSIKWLSHLVLSNLSHANDTYAEQNNDVDSPLKTFCATLSIPDKPRAGEPLAITGWAQAGISGLAKVQVWIHNKEEALPDGDPHFRSAPWRDAEILPPPTQWPHLPGGKLPQPTRGFDVDGKTRQWPMRLTHAHWALLHPGLPAGQYTLRCRTIDQQGQAQPMPRPFRKSGHAAIERRSFVIE